MRGYGLISDILRQVANLVFAIGQVIASFFSQLTGIGVAIGERAGGVNPAAPAGYAFAIWGIIFPACIAYALYQALPAQREHPLLRRIGWYTAAAFGLTTLWALLAQLGDGDWGLAGLLLVIWGALLPAYIIIARTGPREIADRLLVAFPVNILAGWLSVAVFAAFGAAFAASGVQGAGSYMLLVLLAGIVGAAFTIAGRGNIAFPLTVTWGLIGVTVANAARPTYAPVALVAGAMAVLVVFALAFTYRRALRAA